MLRQDVLQHAELVRTGELDGEGGILMNVLGAYGSVGELVSQAGCYYKGETEKGHRAAAHGQWILDSKKLMSSANRERMRRRLAGASPCLETNRPTPPQRRRLSSQR